MTRALEHSGLHADGVLLCLRQLARPELSRAPLDLRGHQHLVQGPALPNPQRYEQLLVAGRRWAWAQTCCSRAISRSAPARLCVTTKFEEDAAQVGLGDDRYLLALAEQEGAQRKNNRQERA